MNALRQKILNCSLNVNQFIDIFGEQFNLLHDFSATEQDIIWHAEGNVHIHTDMVLNEMYEILSKNTFNESEQFVLILSALFHDIAKPITTKTIHSDIYNRTCVISPNHEQKGMDYLFHKLLNYVNHKNPDYRDFITFNEVIDIIGAVGYHQMPKKILSKNFNQFSLADCARKAKPYLLYYLEVADFKGRHCDDIHSQLDYLELFRSYMEDYNYFKGFEKTSLNIDNEYILHKGFELLKNGDISMIEEAHAKFFQEKEDYSNLVVLTGLSGVGKSTYINKNYSSYHLISLDNIREELTFRSDQSDPALITRIARDELKKLLAKKENVVFDATNIRFELREKILNIGHNYGALNTLIFMADGVDNIIARDKKREYSVGEKTILNQEYSFQTPEKSETHNVIWVDASIKKGS